MSNVVIVNPNAGPFELKYRKNDRIGKVVTSEDIKTDIKERSKESNSLWMKEYLTKKFIKMKPTKKQIEVCNFCKGIIDTWINSNDINSPTHINDLREFINAEYEDALFIDSLNDALYDLIYAIREVERE